MNNIFNFYLKNRLYVFSGEDHPLPSVIAPSFSSLASISHMVSKDRISIELSGNSFVIAFFSQDSRKYNCKRLFYVFLRLPTLWHRMMYSHIFVRFQNYMPKMIMSTLFSMRIYFANNIVWESKSPRFQSKHHDTSKLRNL